MDKKVYVLVPVYNVEKVLKDCLDSVINQTYQNWEMIITDDGSTDNSGKICDMYAEKDKRIRVIHQKNQGLAMARKTSVDAIEDEDSYLTFLDSDDILPSSSLEVLIKAAEENGCDIVSGNANKFLNFKKPDINVVNRIEDIKLFEKEAIMKELFVCFFGYGGFSVTLWSKLYKTSLFKKIFSEIQKRPFYYGEDLFVTIRVIPEVARIVEIGNTVYFYRYGGGTNKFMKSFVDDCILLYRTKKEYAEKYGIDDYYKSLIDVEMKNLAMQYLVMCKRSKTYPHGKIEDEIKFILDIPEFYNATSSISEETLKHDYSESPGFTQAFVKKDICEIKRISVQKANEHRLKRFIKNML